jgi:hypothetical protein
LKDNSMRCRLCENQRKTKNSNGEIGLLQNNPFF